MGNFVETTKEASRGGFQGIKTIRGLVKNIDKIDPPASWKDATKKQIQVSLEDAAVLEMFPGEEEFEIKEGKYSFLYPYAEEGKKPSANGPYMRCLVASAEKLGKKPTEFIGQVTTFSKIPVILFKNKDKETGELKEVITENYFSIVPDEGVGSVNTKDYITNLIIGLNQKAALRKLLVDTRAKQFPEFKEKLSAGTLAAELGLVVVDDVFQKAG